jgi:hypothetical protein
MTLGKLPGVEVVAEGLHGRHVTVLMALLGDL